MGYSSYRYMRRDFEKSVEVDLVVLSRFPEAAERDQEGRGIRNSSPGLGGWVWHCLAGGLEKVFTPGFGLYDP